MHYEVDQSGKIENTEKPTVLAYANGKCRTVIIYSRTKRQLQEYFRSIGQNRLFVYQVFTVCTYILLCDIKNEAQIIIDMEYAGKDKLISYMLKKLLIANKRPAHIISFKSIGRRPKVHYAAKDVYAKLKKANYALSYQEVIRLLKVLKEKKPMGT